MAVVVAVDAGTTGVRASAVGENGVDDRYSAWHRAVARARSWAT